MTQETFGLAAGETAALFAGQRSASGFTPPRAACAVSISHLIQAPTLDLDGVLWRYISAARVG